MNNYPFVELVGQPDLSTVLLLGAIECGLGGVLLCGERGTGKSTAARGLADLMAGPYCELPLNASLDRLLGGLDWESAFSLGEEKGRLLLQPGLLAQAHGGVLYVDELNLLPDELLQSLLSASASGRYRLERDGMSLEVPSRFLLVGSMNTEEGELRPQILDRFGLCINLSRSSQVNAIVRARLDFEADPVSFRAQSAGKTTDLRRQLASCCAQKTLVTEEILEEVAALCLSYGVHGLRGDLSLTLAARALATLEGRSLVVRADLERVAPWVLGHRATRQPERQSPQNDRNSEDRPPENSSPEQTQNSQPRDADQEPESTPVASNSEAGEQTFEADSGNYLLQLGSASKPAAPSRARREAQSRKDTTRGREVGSTPLKQGSVATQLSLVATLRAAALSGRRTPLPLSVDDLRVKRRRSPTGKTVIFLVDSSGSMAAARQMVKVKGLVLSLLTQSYQSRSRVALVAVTQGQARLVLAPTRSVDLAQRSLVLLRTGGRSPLAEGLELAARTALREKGAALLVIISDGRANLASLPGDPFHHALESAKRIGEKGIRALCIDTEAGPLRFGRMRELAAALRCPLSTLDETRSVSRYNL